MIKIHRRLGSGSIVRCVGLLIVPMVAIRAVLFGRIGIGAVGLRTLRTDMVGGAPKSLAFEILIARDLDGAFRVVQF